MFEIFRETFAVNYDDAKKIVLFFNEIQFNEAPSLVFEK